MTTYYDETGSIDNSSVLSGADSYSLGYPEVGSLVSDIIVSGEDTFVVTFLETGSIGTLSAVSQSGSGAQGGLAFLFGETYYHDTFNQSELSTLDLAVTISGSDTFSTTITYVESGSLDQTSGVSGADTFNVYPSSGSLASSITLNGSDAYYSTSYIYEEFGTLGNQIVISGADVYGVPETYDEFGSIEDAILLSAANTYDSPYVEAGTLDNVATLSGADGVFYEIVIEANLDASAQFTKRTGKNLLKTVKPRTKIRDNRFYSDLIINVSILPRISRVITRHKANKSHKVREELSRRS